MQAPPTARHSCLQCLYLWLRAQQQVRETQQLPTILPFLYTAAGEEAVTALLCQYAQSQQLQFPSRS